MIFVLGAMAIFGVGLAMKLGYCAQLQEDGEKRTAMMAATPADGMDHEMQAYTAA
jgi:hypothetical protein